MKFLAKISVFLFFGLLYSLPYGVSAFPMPLTDGADLPDTSDASQLRPFRGQLYRPLSTPRISVPKTPAVPSIEAASATEDDVPDPVTRELAIAQNAEEVDIGPLLAAAARAAPALARVAPSVARAAGGALRTAGSAIAQGVSKAANALKSAGGSALDTISNTISGALSSKE